MSIKLKTLYELRNVIDTNPSLLNNEKRLEGIFLDFFKGDYTNVNRLMKGYKYGIVEVILKNDDDIIECNKFINSLVSKEDMIEDMANKVFDYWHIILCNQINVQLSQLIEDDYYLNFLYKIVNASFKKREYEFIILNFPSLKFVNTLNNKLHKHIQFFSFHVKEIGICSPDMILKMSHGEVKKPETINYRTFKPENDGLYCERIFGPTKDWECHCGKYKSEKYIGTVCDKCGVEVTRSIVRGKRMGHITLATPMAHTWYFRTGYISFILNMSQRNLEKVLYFAAYVVLDPGATNLHKLDVLTEREYNEAKEEYGEDTFRVGMGAESIRELLCEIDLQKLEKELKEELVDAKLQKRAKLVKRLEVVEAFIKSGNRPEWMILTVIPVLPPDIRPMVQLDGGRFATSDLNDLYRRIINRNNRLENLIKNYTPEIIIKGEKRMLQQSVDTLYDNANVCNPLLDHNGRRFESFIDYVNYWNKLSDEEKQIALEKEADIILEYSSLVDKTLSNKTSMTSKNDIKNIGNNNFKYNNKEMSNVPQSYNEFIEIEEFEDV